MTTSRPSISIAMATYNGERFLLEQLESLAAQTVAPHELVVCDDGSTDATLEIVEVFAKAAPFPVKIIRNETRLGYADNFLKAASLCSGEWIGFCDQDDVWLKTKLEIVLRVISADPDLLLVNHPAMLTDSDLQPSGEIAWPSQERRHLPLSNDPWRGGMGCGQIFRAWLVKEIPYQPRFSPTAEPGQTSPHDYWIGRLACMLGSIYSLADPLVLRRRHESSVTSSQKPPTIAKRSRLRRGSVKQALYTTADRARDTAEVLEIIAPEAAASRQQSLYVLAQYFRDGHDILLRRAHMRSMGKIAQVKALSALIRDKRYRRLGYGLVGRTGFLRDVSDLLLPTADTRP